MKKFIGIVLFLFLLSPLFGTIYYVDATTGDDSDTGLTEELAWETLSKVTVSNFNAGDIIKLKRGETWTGEYLYFGGDEGNGTLEDPIIVTNYGAGELPIVDTNGGYTYALTIRGNNYWEFDGIQFQGGTTNQVFLYSSASSLTGLKMRNCIIDGASGEHTVRVQESGANTITDIEIYDNVIKDAGAADSDNINIFSCTSGIHIHHNTLYGADGDGVDVAEGDVNIIEMNLIYDNGRNQIKVHGQQGTLTNIRISYNICFLTEAPSNGGHGITVQDSTDGTIVNNTIYMPNVVGSWGAMNFGEPNTANSFTGNIIKNNACYGNPTYNSGCWLVEEVIIDDFDTASTFGNTVWCCKPNRQSSETNRTTCSGEAIE